MIPVTSPMCLGRPPGLPIPKQSALADLASQKVWLEGRPYLKYLEDVWLPWSWPLANPRAKTWPDFRIMVESSVRSLCLITHAKIVRLVEARPDDACPRCDASFVCACGAEALIVDRCSDLHCRTDDPPPICMDCYAKQAEDAEHEE